MNREVKFKHFLLTRYNVGIYDCKYKTKHKEKIQPEAWMQEREVLWHKYCRASIIAQTSKEFEHIVVYDDRTPKTPNGGTKVFGRNFRKASIDTIRAKLDGTETHLVTTRIDCDDSVHKKHVEKIQEWFRRKQKTGIVTFPYGYVYNIQKERLHSVKEESNHFLTLVEKIKWDDKWPKFKTVLCRRHTDILTKFKVHRLELTPMWCEIVHENNVSNHSRGYPRNIKKFKRELFGI